VKPPGISRIKKGISFKKLMSLRRTFKTRTSEICIEEQINLRGVNILEVTY
jgi:hypothetical protein